MIVQEEDEEDDEWEPSSGAESEVEGAESEDEEASSEVGVVSEAEEAESEVEVVSKNACTEADATSHSVGTAAAAVAVASPSVFSPSHTSGVNSEHGSPLGEIVSNKTDKTPGRRRLKKFNFGKVQQ